MVVALLTLECRFESSGHVLTADTDKERERAESELDARSVQSVMYRIVSVENRRAYHGVLTL